MSATENKKLIVKKKGKGKFTKAPPPPGTVVYVGHLPHGFYEGEILKYFSQFGIIRRFHLARSRKTGGSKGWAFLQFECAEVAKVVADTMNNYLFFEKLLKCEVVPKKNINSFMFRGWMKGCPLPSDANREQQNRPKSGEKLQQRVDARLRRTEKLKETLRNMGIEYDCPVKKQ